MDYIGKTKYFDRDVKGNIIPAIKLYINNRTYNIESRKTDNNFEVDKLIAESIFILNKKGYKTISSNAGHVYYYFSLKTNYNKDNLINDNDRQYMYVGYHAGGDGGIPVKYEIIPEGSNEFIEYKNQYPEFQLPSEYGLFKVTLPVVVTIVRFIEKYYFPNLPNDFYTSGTAIMHQIFYEFDELDLEKLENMITQTNKELLEWVKQLSDKK